MRLMTDYIRQKRTIIVLEDTARFFFPKLNMERR